MSNIQLADNYVSLNARVLVTFFYQSKKVGALAYLLKFDHFVLNSKAYEFNRQVFNFFNYVLNYLPDKKTITSLTSYQKHLDKPTTAQGK